MEIASAFPAVKSLGASYWLHKIIWTSDMTASKNTWKLFKVIFGTFSGHKIFIIPSNNPKAINISCRRQADHNQFYLKQNIIHAHRHHNLADKFPHSCRNPRFRNVLFVPALNPEHKRNGETTGEVLITFRHDTFTRLRCNGKHQQTLHHWHPVCVLCCLCRTVEVQDLR